jgi:hypothetical protein
MTIQAVVYKLQTIVLRESVKEKHKKFYYFVIRIYL